MKPIPKLITTLLISLFASAGVAGELIAVYKSPTCGCCSAWIEHLKANGFDVQAHDTTRMDQVKQALGVQPQLASCHTAEVAGYVIEGHVPASDIHRLLAEKPAVAGLAAPGMPMGSPGMEGPRKDHYQVLTFDREGNSRVYAEH
ncbi:DUF411 domain-containing protein [Sedimenticola sp.]|uniref:DUF411 domain-containing protein n=1 Tax=Sedimenticola sp. TaxID=1940285 RepID=UPI003D14E833